MEIVIDTNSLYGDLKLTGAKIRTLCETAKKTGEVVCLPQVVIDEAKNKYEEILQNNKSRINKELSDIKRLTGHDFDTSFNDKNILHEISVQSKVFDAQVAKLCIKIIPYPKTSHEIIARRAVKKQKPFTTTGNGYRDALIWENIKSIIKPSKKLIEDPQVVFITANHKDFCEKDYQLHSDLKEELIKLGVSENYVEIIDDFEKFIEKYCKPKLKILNDIKKEFEKGKHKTLHVRSKVEKLVFSYLNHREFNLERIGFPIEFESPSISGIHEDYKFTINEIRQLSEEEIVIDGTVDVTCDFDIFIFKQDYYTMFDAKQPSIWDYNWNDHYLAGSQEKTIKLGIYLTVDCASYDIISSEIELMES